MTGRSRPRGVGHPTVRQVPVPGRRGQEPLVRAEARRAVRAHRAHRAAQVHQGHRSQRDPARRRAEPTMPYRRTVHPAADRPVPPRRRRRNRVLPEVAVPRRPHMGQAHLMRLRLHRKSQAPRVAAVPRRCHKRERHPAAGRLRTRRRTVHPAAARPGRLRQAAANQAVVAANQAVAVAANQAVAVAANRTVAAGHRGADRTSRRPVRSVANQAGIAIPGPGAAVHRAGAQAGIPGAGVPRRSSGRRLRGRREAVARPVPAILHLDRARRVRRSGCCPRREARAPEGACSRTRRPPVIVSARISVRRPLRAYRCTPGQRALPAPESRIPRLANAPSPLANAVLCGDESIQSRTTQRSRITAGSVRG